jgi:hypothetical protein
MTVATYPPIRFAIWPPEVGKQLYDLGERDPLPERYTMGEGKHQLTIYLSQWEGYWRISITRPGYPPTWDEIKHIQNELYPGVFFCIPMPPKECWFSIAPNMYHLEEVKDERQIRRWRLEGQIAGEAPEGTTILEGYGASLYRRLQAARKEMRGG